MSERLKTADEYHVEPGVGFVIDGKPLPWYVAEEGPMVEALDPDLPLHIVWVPIIAEGHCPRAGRPDAEPLTGEPTDEEWRCADCGCTPEDHTLDDCGSCGDCYHPHMQRATEEAPDARA